MTTLSWSIVIDWLGRRRQAGPLSLALRPSWKIVIPLSLFVVWSGITLVIPLFNHQQLDQPFLFVVEIDGPLVNAGIRITLLSWLIAIFLMLVTGTEIRKHGCISVNRF